MHEVLSSELVRLVNIQRNWFFSVNSFAGLPEPIPASIFQVPDSQSCLGQNTSQSYALCQADILVHEDNFLQGAVETVKELSTIAAAGLSVIVI